LSGVPVGAWFCTECKPLVRQALEEEQALQVRRDKKEKEKKEDVAALEQENDDDVMQLTAQQWRQQQQQWRAAKEEYEKALAEKTAEVERLRGELDRVNHQPAPQKGPSSVVAEEEIKDPSMQDNEQQTSEGREQKVELQEQKERKEAPEHEERKEAPPQQDPDEQSGTGHGERTHGSNGDADEQKELPSKKHQVRAKQTKPRSAS
jgi:hypothetical protein